MRSLASAYEIFIGLLGVAWAMLAQTDSASLRVLVEDASNAPVAAATVVLTNKETGLRTEFISSEDGYAVFSPILRGLYEVNITKAGFKTIKVDNLRVQVDERRLLRTRLEVASVSETVEVSANVTSIQTEQGSLGQVIGGKTAVELPLAGRRYTELALLSLAWPPARSTLSPAARAGSSPMATTIPRTTSSSMASTITKARKTPRR